MSAIRRLVFTQFICFNQTRYLTFVIRIRVSMLPSWDCGPEINHWTLRPTWAFCEIPGDVRVRIERQLARGPSVVASRLVNGLQPKGWKGRKADRTLHANQNLWKVGVFYGNLGSVGFLPLRAPTDNSWVYWELQLALRFDNSSFSVSQLRLVKESLD